MWIFHAIDFDADAVLPHELSHGGIVSGFDGEPGGEVLQNDAGSLCFSDAALCSGEFFSVSSGDRVEGEFSDDDEAADGGEEDGDSFFHGCVGYGFFLIELLLGVVGVVCVGGCCELTCLGSLRLDGLCVGELESLFTMSTPLKSPCMRFRFEAWFNRF